MLPKNLHTDHTYRDFHIVAMNSVTGVASGYATHQELDIRLSRTFQKLSLDQVRAAMRRQVDDTIAERKLDIPPEVEPPAEEEESADDIYRRIHKKHLEKERQRKMSKTYHLDATVGVQAGEEMFNATIPLKLVVDLIDIEWIEVPVEERYQRIPNKARVDKIKNYVIETQDSYILPSITVSVAGDFEFIKYEGSATAGTLTFNPGVKLYLLDGGHRRKSIEKIIGEVPKLGKESIGVYMVRDRGLEQRQQWFATINLTMVKPPKTLALQYDQSDREANFNRNVIDAIPLFSKYTNRENGSAKDNKLFVLTWFYTAHKVMRSNISYDADLAFCVAFWQAVIANIPAWDFYDPSKEDPKKVRAKICCTAIFIKALAIIASDLAFIYCREEKPNMASELKDYLLPLSEIKWNKDNPEFQGVIVQDNKILTQNVNQFTQFLIQKLGPFYNRKTK